MRAIAAGGFQTMALVDDGVQDWGNRYGEIPSGGLYGGGGGAPTVPAWVAGWTSGVQAVASGYTNACAVLNGGVQCWGDNTLDELGNDTSLISLVPLRVPGLSGVTAVAMGDSHVCAVVNGGVQCWGGNINGTLGNGSTAPSSAAPVQVVGLESGVQAIGAGDGDTCAVVDGGVQCWGMNYNGQLGNGVPDAGSAVPLPVVGLSGGARAIAAGFAHTCAWVDDGVECWGSNSNGQLGNDSSIESHLPVRVQGLGQGVTAIAAGSSHTCAVVDGGVLCWGANSDGQLGNGSTTDSAVPVPVAGLSTGVTAIAAGWAHTCAVVNGDIQCWGANDFGQLGNNSTAESDVPVSVCPLEP